MVAGGQWWGCRCLNPLAGACVGRDIAGSQGCSVTVLKWQIVNYLFYWSLRIL